MSYEYGFARVYDKFTENTEVEGRAAFTVELLRKYGVNDGFVLDLACGTGRLSEALIRAGYDLICTDVSEDMLAEARRRLQPYGEKALILQQDMRAIDLYGTVRACVCSLDSVNHLISAEDVRRVFALVSLFTEPGGVFVFDVNSVYKHEAVLADNTFVYEDDTDLLVWQNEYDPGDRTVQMLIDVFSLRPDGAYDRFSEEITERAYTVEELTEMLSGAGFREICVFGDRRTAPPDETEERIWFAALK